MDGRPEEVVRMGKRIGDGRRRAAVEEARQRRRARRLVLHADGRRAGPRADEGLRALADGKLDARPARAVVVDARRRRPDEGEVDPPGVAARGGAGQDAEGEVVRRKRDGERPVGAQVERHGRAARDGKGEDAGGGRRARPSRAVLPDERHGASADEQLAAPGAGDRDAQDGRPVRGLRPRERRVRRARGDPVLPGRVRRAERAAERIRPAEGRAEGRPRRVAARLLRRRERQARDAAGGGHGGGGGEDQGVGLSADARLDALQQVVRREAREVVAERDAARRAQLGLEGDRAVRPTAEQRVPPREEKRPVRPNRVPEAARPVARGEEPLVRERDEAEGDIVDGRERDARRKEDPSAGEGDQARDGLAPGRERPAVRAQAEPVGRRAAKRPVRRDARARRRGEVERLARPRARQHEALARAALRPYTSLQTRVGIAARLCAREEPRRNGERAQEDAPRRRLAPEETSEIAERTRAPSVQERGKPRERRRAREKK